MRRDAPHPVMRAHGRSIDPAHEPAPQWRITSLPYDSPMKQAFPDRLGRWRWSVCAVLIACALLPGCGSVPHGAASSRPALSTRSEQSTRLGQNVALYALSMLDRDYRWGGRAPAQGFDCSGLVSHVYREAAGIELRGNAATLSRLSHPVEIGAVQAGDLLFFNTLGPPSSHVGVYVGNGRFVHAANERSGVRIDRLSDRYYASRFEGAKAVLD